MTRGVDYAWAHPRPGRIAAAGYTFVLRYLSNDAAKNITLPEANALHAAGLDIGVVWESTADGTRGGAAAGAQDGRRAKQEADSAGATPASAVYFAVDFDAQPSDMAAVDAYARAFAIAVAPHPVGVYGGLAVCDHLAATVAYRWQTVAWSHGRRSAGICLYQAGTVTIDGVACDVNEQLAPFGGWYSTTSPSPQPPAVVTPFPEDHMARIDIHVEGLDGDGHGDTLLDGRDAAHPAVPAGTVFGVRVNSAGHADPRGPRSDGDQDNGGHAQIQWVGPPNAPGFDARIFYATG